jgi:hypothetical protein
MHLPCITPHDTTQLLDPYTSLGEEVGVFTPETAKVAVTVMEAGCVNTACDERCVLTCCMPPSSA